MQRPIRVGRKRALEEHETRVYAAEGTAPSTAEGSAVPASFGTRADRTRSAPSAGTLDEPTGVKAVGHVWLSQAGDYYEVADELEKAETRPEARP